LSLESCIEGRLAAERRAIDAQEALDWEVYRAFGLTTVPAPRAEGNDVGRRPFELRIAAGGGEAADATWHRWLGIAAPTGEDLNADERAAVEALDRAQSEQRMLALLETGTAKRRWRQPAGKAAQEPESPAKILRDQGWQWLRTQLERCASVETEPFTAAHLISRLPPDWPKGVWMPS
jgi:hypothetical protein